MDQRNETQGHANAAADALRAIDENGARFVESRPASRLMTTARDVNRVIEACFGAGTGAALLYAANLPDAFFDVSSGDAGEILQKLRNYHIRLAIVVTAADRARFSTRFGDLMAAERQDDHFGLFDSRETARDWLHGGSR